MSNTLQYNPEIAPSETITTELAPGEEVIITTEILSTESGAFAKINAAGAEYEVGPYSYHYGNAGGNKVIVAEVPPQVKGHADRSMLRALTPGEPAVFGRHNALYYAQRQTGLALEHFSVEWDGNALLRIVDLSDSGLTIESKVVAFAEESVADSV